MTGISDEFIAEAALVAPVGVAAPRKNPFASLSRALNSGWGVACICFIVAIASVVGMVAWGRMGEMTGPGSDPAVRFAFSYEMTANDGSAWSGTAMPGDIVNGSTTIVNHGKTFVTDDFFAWAKFVLQEDESVVIEGDYPLVETIKHPVKNGDQGTISFHFHIPENATPGVYDLVLSYDGEKQVFGGALTVGETEGETQPPEDTIDRYGFSFGYELGGDAAPGTSYHMDTWVVNEGASFTFEGSSMGFAPSAVLIHMDTQYRIEGNFDTTDDYTTVTVKTGDKGQVTQAFMIPADAPTGAYALQLSYDGVSKSFAGVVIVAEPTVIDPAVLYNLTMPIGSDQLYEPIDEAYVDGELVTVRVKFATVVSPLFFLNGELITPIAGDDQLGYWEYNFIMPQKDSEIIFHTYDGTAPYAYLLKSYYTAHPKAESASVSRIYGEYENGAVAALINGTPPTALAWEESIYTKKIRYTNGNQIWVYHEGSLYTLQEAYAQGILSLADIEMIENTQKDLYPDLYAYDLELIQIAREYLSAYIPSDTLDDYSANVGMMPESFSYDVVSFYADPWGEQIALVWVDRDTYACTHEIDEERFKKLESYRPYLTEENMVAALRAIEAQFLDYNTYLLSPELRGTIYDMHLFVWSRLNELILYGTYYSPAVGGHHIKQHNFEVKICDYT